MKEHHRVIAPDLPGFGLSERGARFGGSLDEHADFVVAFCRALDVQPRVIFMMDASGAVGLTAASRMAGSVRGVVLADTAPIPLTGIFAVVRFFLRFVVASRWVRWLNRKTNFLPWLVVTVAPWRRPFSRDERRALVREFDTEEKRDHAIELFENMGRDTGFMERAAAASAALEKTPALLLYGALDPMRLLGGVGRFRRLLPNHTVAIVAGEEHFPMLAAGAEVGRIVVDWMTRVVDGR
jgi:haloalkane dehalogenase